MERLTLIIPVYNEGEVILETLNEIHNKVKTTHIILIIYDTDDDSTLEVIKKSGQSLSNVRFVKNLYGKGALNAVKTGYHFVDTEYFLLIMADLADDISQVDHMVDLMDQGFDVVCGSRYVRGGHQIGGGLIKKTLSRAAGVSLHILTGIPTHDISNSFKMYNTKILQQITFESIAGFEILMELIVKAFLLGYRITEIPTTWKDRKAGDSRFNLFGWLEHYLRWYFYALKHTYLKRKYV